MSLLLRKRRRKRLNGRKRPEITSRGKEKEITAEKKLFSVGKIEALSVKYEERK